MIKMKTLEVEGELSARSEFSNLSTTLNLNNWERIVWLLSYCFVINSELNECFRNFYGPSRYDIKFQLETSTRELVLKRAKCWAQLNNRVETSRESLSLAVCCVLYSPDDSIIAVIEEKPDANPSLCACRENAARWKSPKTTIERQTPRASLHEKQSLTITFQKTISCTKKSFHLITVVW